MSKYNNDIISEVSEGNKSNDRLTNKDQTIIVNDSINESSSIHQISKKYNLPFEGQSEDEEIENNTSSKRAPKIVNEVDVNFTPRNIKTIVSYDNKAKSYKSIALKNIINDKLIDS